MFAYTSLYDPFVCAVTSRVRSRFFDQVCKILLSIGNPISFTELQFQLENPSHPDSVCSLPCGNGKVKKYVEGESCCWTCRNCGTYQVSFHIQFFDRKFVVAVTNLVLRWSTYIVRYLEGSLVESKKLWNVMVCLFKFRNF